MKSPSACLLALGTAGALALAVLPAASRGQDTPAVDPVAGLVDEVVAQQAKIVENQKAIDEKVASIGEAVRQARAFASRGK